MSSSRIPWIVLGISIITTILVWSAFLNLENQKKESEFDAKSTTMTNDFLDRLEQYEQILKGARGLLSSTSEITPHDWEHFVSLQGISKFADVQAIGYTKHVQGEVELDNLITQMKNYGVEDFSITPEGKRDDYYPVIFMEPLDSRNKRAIGYDTYFEDSRKAAVDHSIKSGNATLSGKIILVQETETDKQNGFLLMMPVFSNDHAPDQDHGSGYEQSSVEGMVNAVFRINDFVDGLVGKEKFEYVHLRIYDESSNPENLFFDSNFFYDYKAKKIDFSSQQNLEFASRTWILVYEGMIPPLTPFEGFFLYLFPVIGFSLSGLLFYVFYLANKNLQLAQRSVKTKKLENIGKLAAALAHDLRNPLSVASGAMYLLLKKSENMDEGSKNLIAKSNTAIERMRRQINDVMDFVQTGDLNVTKVSLKEIINIPEVTLGVGSNITLNLPQKDVLLNCDKRKITVLITNLISNAVQAIGDKTGTIIVRFLEEDKNVIIEVEDSGPGIPKEKIKNIFEPLYTTRQTGTGLGLASCKHIVDSHKGNIVVTNNPTLFRISLPKINLS